MSEYIELKDLEVYKLSRELSRNGWQIYNKLVWQIKKIMGDQFITATDSVGANVAEGYGRFHYLDKNKFYYNARGSLIEAGEHWLELMMERKVVEEPDYQGYLKIYNQLKPKLNKLISAIKDQKKK
jgi:four helix bundle protein